MKRIAVGAVLLAALSVLFGCDGGSSSTNNDNSTYSISGTVTADSAGLQSVTISLAGTSLATATTDPNGNYTFAGLTNGNHTITPSMTGYTFNPISISQTVNGASISAVNFVGTIATAAYSQADLAGTWYSAGIKTPVNGTSTPANFGYDVDGMVISNGTATVTTVSSSDSYTTDTGTISITSDGVIFNGPDQYSFLNAAKDVMVFFFKDSATGEQQLFVDLKKASSYSTADLDGTWYSAGIKTPVKNTSNSANFGYDVDTMVISNGTATVTTVSSSDSYTADTGTISITNDGTISVVEDTSSNFFMNAGKDVMYQLFADTVAGEQQLFVSVKKASSYSLGDLAGTWYSVAINTPVKNSSNSNNFGYDIDHLAITDNGAFTSTTIATSGDSETGTGTFSIDNNGRVSVVGDPIPHYIYMNAGKNMMVEFWHDVETGRQQMWINVKLAQ